MNQKTPEALNVMLFPQGCGSEMVWVAQCVTHDFAAQGKTITQAQENFSNTLRTHVILAVQNGEKPLENVPPAPAWFAREFEQASQESVKTVPRNASSGPRQVIFKHVLAAA
jgi:predicted RNase H-like HicB family nuclease